MGAASNSNVFVTSGTGTTAVIPHGLPETPVTFFCTQLGASPTLGELWVKALDANNASVGVTTGVNGASVMWTAVMAA